MAAIKGVIFDLDGTLIDSMKMWNGIDRQFLMENGVEISPVVHDVQPKRDWSSRVLLLEAE